MVNMDAYKQTIIEYISITDLLKSPQKTHNNGYLVNII